MSTETTEHHLPASDVAVNPPPRTGNPWLPTPHGVSLMARIELRRRRPSTKGYILYGILFAIVIAICLSAAIFTPAQLSSTNFEIVLVMVLGVGMLIAPSLSATSINGDSGEGVLAPLQMSHLTAGDIAIGKLLASWTVSVFALVALSPFLVYTFLNSGWRVGEMLMTIGAILFVVLTFTAVGLAWSAIAARAVASVALAHLTTGFFVIGTLIVFGVSTLLFTEEATQRDRYIDWEQLTPEAEEALNEAYMTGDYSALDPADYQCVDSEWAYTITHTEHVAWILLTNPAVMITETAPIVDPETWEEDGRAAPGLFATIHQLVSQARLGPVEQLDDHIVYDECAQLFQQAEASDMSDEELEENWAEEEARHMERQQEVANLDRAPWIGLGVTGALLVGSMWIVVNRLRVPYKKLRSGTRVA
ncbi:ABC transporter permease [Demequina sp. NBRC 110053]|uniref:ABC transporter permease n=1 Tax=Demequina sp. NBRC 110053 TaxID=1570342 RepID=UPI0009FD9181|nr:ABC transporter permease subunit [Demequina sp. NBRC 110053]